MWTRLAGLFTIKNRFEAFAIIYALALGATSRGADYIEHYPGLPGILLFAACTVAVFMAGGKILDAVRPPAIRMIRRGPFRAPPIQQTVID
ncbi:hypothetical protein [Allosphingosinicella vermicomposti]|uniref:hypothetical protein n=1 Tax=Allosphingosinicella vermicomposti TaxID=614671 RepID=UPI001FE00C3D|nr:hypothetical protein [Allosphingosinicella vermicomposti]